MCRAPIIAITGTSGKTTVAALTCEMLRASGQDAIVCGNIGSPFSGEIKRIRGGSIVVLEVSSFQLERIKLFKPAISIILNISTNHLDRHKDMDEYASLKFRICSNQDKGGLLFLNGKDRLLRQFSNRVNGPRVEFFDEYRGFGRRYNIKNEDFLGALCLASEMGAREEAMLDVLSRFKGIEHRLEHFATVEGIDFINDSKATTVSSVLWALESLDGRIILIMGGRYKGGDFGVLKDYVERKVGCIVVMGEAAPRIKEGLKGVKDIFEEQGMDKAVERAFRMAKKGDKVLLSPGCSSFDMFKDYEERGRVFKELCFGLGRRVLK